MTDEEINESITEATGLWDHPYSSETKVMMDFCSDLNAMHEAERMLTDPAIRRDYVEKLGVVCNEAARFATIHATARQRAEAFLRTLGKWKE